MPDAMISAPREGASVHRPANSACYAAYWRSCYRSLRERSSVKYLCCAFFWVFKFVNQNSPEFAPHLAAANVSCLRLRGKYVQNWVTQNSDENQLSEEDEYGFEGTANRDATGSAYLFPCGV